MTTLSLIIAHPANQGRAIRAVGRYLGWQFAKRTIASHWDIAYHGLLLRCHRDSHSASAALYFNAMPDYREMSFILRYLRPGDTFLDVGANVGVYTLLAAGLVGPNGVIHAFEPGSLALLRLRENVALNKLKNVQIHEQALADHNGEGRLDVGGDDCVARLVPKSAGTGVTGTAKIDCVTLDDCLANSVFAMAKLDIEGAEPLALRGAMNHLNSGNPPVLQIEMAGYSKKYGVATHEFIAWLSSVGYDVGIYDPVGNSIEYTDRPWAYGALNVLAVSRARRTEVLDRLNNGS